MLNSLIICLFARKVYDKKTILLCLNSIGYNLNEDDLISISDRIYKTKLRIKKMLGFDLSNVRLPKRIFETPSATGSIEEDLTYELIGMYKDKIEKYMS